MKKEQSLILALFFLYFNNKMKLFYIFNRYISERTFQKQVMN